MNEKRYFKVIKALVKEGGFFGGRVYILLSVVFMFILHGEISKKEEYKLNTYDVYQTACDKVEEISEKARKTKLSNISNIPEYVKIGSQINSEDNKIIIETKLDYDKFVEMNKSKFQLDDGIGLLHDIENTQILTNEYEVREIENNYLSKASYINKLKCFIWAKSAVGGFIVGLIILVCIGIIDMFFSCIKMLSDKIKNKKRNVK